MSLVRGIYNSGPSEALSAVDRLPPAARDLVRRMRDALEDKRAIDRSAGDRMAELHKRMQRLTARRQAIELGVGLGTRTLGTHISADETGGTGLLMTGVGPSYTPPTKAEIAAALAPIDVELAQLAEEYGRVETRRDLARASEQRLGGLLNALENWLQKMPADVKLTEYRAGGLLTTAPAPIRITPEQIETKRRRIRELLADLRATDAAPMLAADAKAVWRDQLEQLAERGRPSVYPAIERREAIEFPKQIIINYRGADQEIPDAHVLVAWLMKDQLAAAVDAEIDANADDAAALSTHARRARFREILSDLLAAEREEEALIAAAGFDIDRRPDADPRAVLGLASDLPAPRRELFHAELAYAPEPVARSAAVRRRLAQNVSAVPGLAAGSEPPPASIASPDQTPPPADGDSGNQEA
ncbi:hypothetical protein [Rhodoplanes sp. SY1]|uniref:hypothetical protein n=1 Tax=Rhodoplanes sp. SY1 TaxID=3166646 RepID=UPI0038B62EB0